MNIIAYFIKNNKDQENIINNFFKENKISNLLKASNFNKEKGLSSTLVFKIIFVLVFTNKNLFRFLETEQKIIGVSKDVVYRFLNSASHNWAKFLILLSSNVIKNKVFPLSSKDRVNVLIVDDSTYEKNSSKKVELLARVKDHTVNKYLKGFKLLSLGWSDGNTFIPVGFNLLSSGKKSNRLCPVNDNVDKRTNGYKARKIAIMKKTEVMIDLVKKAVSAKIPAKYVLFDSWFTYPSIIGKITSLNIDVIAMVKKMPNVFYEYNGANLNLQQLYKAVKKKRGKAKIISSVIVKAKADDGKYIDLKIVFVRNRNKKREWLAIITSDINLTDEEIVRIYGKRWDIEVFFKMTKSHLKLAKEFQSRSYDALVAHTTIVFVRYIMLALQKRKTEDPRTIGGLFYECSDELEDIKFTEVITMIMDILISAVKDLFFATKEQIQKLITYFLDSLPNIFKRSGCFLCCES